MRLNDSEWAVMDRVWVHLGHREWDVGIHAPGARVVDDRSALLDGYRSPLERKLVRYIEQRDVDAFENLGGERNDLNRATPGRQLAARGR